MLPKVSENELVRGVVIASDVEITISKYSEDNPNFLKATTYWYDAGDRNERFDCSDDLNKLIRLLYKFNKSTFVSSFYEYKKKVEEAEQDVWELFCVPKWKRLRSLKWNALQN